MKKNYLLAAFFALAQCCEGITDVRTYILGTDKAYLQPTIQAIHSLNRNTPGQKRIIVLETDNIYGTEEEASSFLELSLGENVTLLRWQLSKLTAGVDPDIKIAYDRFRETVGSKWRDYETVTSRVLFPVLFDKDNLEQAGYASNLELTPEGQLLNHFVWLDSDIVPWRNLNDFYELSTNLPTNSDGIAQTTMSVNLLGELISCKSAIENRLETSGGVVFWNLDSCRKILTKSSLIDLLLKSKFSDEVFIDHLLDFWNKDGEKIYSGGKIYYMADKLFNVSPGEWLRAKCYCNFLKYLNAEEKDRESYLEKVIDFWPVVLFEDKSLDESKRPDTHEIRLFLEKVLKTPLNTPDKLTYSDYKDCVNVFEENENRYTALSMFKLFVNTKNNATEFSIDSIKDSACNKSQKLLDRLQYIDETPAILHWDCRKKPWRAIAEFLAEKQVKISPENIFEVLNFFVQNKVLDPAYTLWIDNFLSWIRADEVNNNAQRRTIRQKIACEWINSLM